MLRLALCICNLTYSSTVVNCRRLFSKSKHMRQAGRLV
jgi:hypothetical protein